MSGDIGVRRDEHGRLRVAVVGAGKWGLQHARAFAARPDVELVAVAGRTPERTLARAEQFGTRGYIDLEEMLARERPDLVSVCLPNLEHFAPTLALLERGVPLLVEKPLVFDLAEADALLAAAERRRAFFAVNFNHRYAPPVRLARETIRAGRVGAPAFATWRFGGEGRSRHPHANLIETQCHGFDLLEDLVGPIESVMAEMTGAAEAWSTLVLALRFQNGAVGSLVGSYDSSYAYPDTHLLEINGRDGRVLIEDTVRRFSYQRAGSELAEVWQAGYFNDRDRTFTHTFDAYLDAMLAAFRAGEDPPVPARAGRRALQLAWAAVESFETGRRVPVA